MDFDSIEYFIFSNGAGIYKRGSGVVFHSEINRETAKRVVELLGNYEVFIELYINGTPTVDKNKFSEEAFDYYSIDRDFYPELIRSRKPVDNFEALLGGSLDGLEMFDLFFKNQEERAACAEAFNKYFPELEYTTSMTDNLEAMNAGINKGSGLMRLCEAENIDINDIYALGDSKNDLAMCEAVENCFAVAVERAGIALAVLADRDRTTGDTADGQRAEGAAPANDGVAKYLRHVNLPP